MSPFLNGFRGATSSAMYLALAPGSPPASAHQRARTRYAVAAASAETPRPPCTCTAMVAAFDASSAMKTNADGASSGRSSGSLSQEPRCTTRKIAPALHGDRNVGKRMGDALKRRDRHTQRVAGLANSAAMVIVSSTSPVSAAAISTRHSSSARWYSAKASDPLGQHDAGVGGSGIHPGHRQATDVVDLCRPGIEAEPHHVLAVANDDLIRDRSGWDEPTPTHAVVLWIERREPLADDDIWLPPSPIGRAAVPHTHGRSMARAQVSGRSPRRPMSDRPGSLRLPRRRRATAIVVAPIPHSPLQRLLSKPDSSAARTVSIEQCVLKKSAVRSLQSLMVFGQACSRSCGVRSDPWSVLSWPSKKKVCALL